MSLYILIFYFCLAVAFMLFMQYIKPLNNIKRIIGIFWFLLLGILFYGMFFESTRGFITLFQQGFWVIICIFLAGVVSIFIEKQYNNISIIYFLFWYFGIPIFYAISVNYSLLKGEITLQTFIKIVFYIGFFLFALLSIMGFVAWIKARYIFFKICFIAVIFFYFPFLFVAGIIFRWLNK